ncbi:MAG: hypothetical protein Q4G19_07860 [Clostridia bacterium]|nr:hypothetical protein [Clostridia bacterium]
MKKRFHTEHPSFRKYISLALMIVFGYLFHVCVMPYLKIGGVTPNLLYALIGIITVSHGRLCAFWAGCCFGILTEIMIPSVTFFSLALYPLTALFCSFGFADKPAQRLEYERSLRKSRRQITPLARTVLCAAVNTLVYNAINLAYVYISGNALTSGHYARAFTDVAATALLTAVLMLPLRRLIFGRWDHLHPRLWLDGLRQKRRHHRPGR